MRYDTIGSQGLRLSSSLIGRRPGGLYDCRRRVLGVLLELLDSSRERLGQNPRIRLRLSHQKPARLIGATRETVTIVPRRLRIEEFIRVARCRIAVLDRDRLIAESHAD